MSGSPLSWREPLVLVALVLVPLLVLALVWARRRRNAALAAFADIALLPALVPDLDPRRRRLRAAALVGVVLLLVLGLAGPMWGFRWEQVRREGVDLIVAIDTSRSMLATDVRPSRLARAKLAVRDLVSQLHGDRVGLVAFAGRAFVQCPLTLDYGAVAQSLDAIDVGIIPKGGTALAEAIDSSLDAFEGREGKHQAIILITDGEDHEGKVKEATARAAERGVKVFTIGLGTSDGELIPSEKGGFLKDRAGQVVKSRLDQDTLQQIAVDTGGVYLHSTGASLALTDLYRDYIGRMEKREVASTLEKRFEQRYQVPLAFAFVLLVIEMLIGERRVERRRWRRSARGGERRALAAALLLALASVAWLDPHARTREANRLFAAGKYDEAAALYNEGLVDQPDSGLLHFNLGDARYKQGKYDDALAAFQQVHPREGDATETARAAYNAGNVSYRLAEGLATSDPHKALERYAEALLAYRRAIVAAPDDVDAKLNYELTMQKRAELQKKLDEQRQQQQQAQDQQDQQQQQKDEQQKDGQQQDQQQQAQDQKRDEQENGGEQQQQQAAQASPAPAASPQGAQQNAADEHGQRGNEGNAEESDADSKASADAAAEAAGGEPREGEMTRQEATALLDAQRGQEVQPGEVVRRLQGAAVGEPAEDW
jgi:Ca-activated chloride channel family protein